MKEADIMRAAMLETAKHGSVLFRNNVAQAVVGQVEWIKQAKTVTLAPGDAVVRRARVLHAGLCEGSSDTIGWTRLIVTPEMVGRPVALFTAVEFKDKGKATDGQARFVSAVRVAGGLAGVAYSVEQAVSIVKAL